MKSGQSLLFILSIGIGGLFAFGLITKFALDSNPSLMKIGKLKKAIAQDFSSQGLEEVSVRRRPGGSGFDLRIECARANHSDPAAFAKKIAQSFLKNYSGPAPITLKLALVEPVGFGCQGSDVYFEKEFNVATLRAELMLLSSLDRFGKSLPSGRGYKMVSFELARPPRIRVEIPPPGDPADLERSISLLRENARRFLSAGTGREVILEIWSGGPKPKLIREERMERNRSGRRRRAVRVTPEPSRSQPAPKGAVRQGSPR